MGLNNLQLKKEADKEREFVDKAIGISIGCIDAWAYLFQHLKQNEGEDKAIAVKGASAISTTVKCSPKKKGPP